MAHAVIMPKAGMAMESGTILKWLKKEGDPVKVGEAILEIETDKVAMEVEAEYSGVLLRITRHEGEEIPVTETIGYIGEAGEEISEPDPSAKVQQEIAPAAQEPEVTAPAGSNSTGPTTPARRHGRVAATPLARTLAAEQGIDLSGVAASGPSGEVKGRDVLAAMAGGGSPEVKVSPLARRIADLNGVDLAQVRGSGPDGKIMKRDLETVGKAAPREDGQAVRVPLTGVRKTIARRMSASHASIPPVTLNADIDVTELLALKDEVRSQTEKGYSLNDFILMAVVRGLVEHPALIQQIDGDEIVTSTHVNLGIAVSVEDLLFVPVVHAAETLSFSQLAERVHALIEKARNRRLGPDELAGATFSVTNLGMFGIRDFTPIINPPESAILGVGTVRDELRLHEGQVESRSKMTLSLTIDHRIVDGVAGARLLATLRELLERPLRLLA